MESERLEPQRLIGWHVVEAGRRQAWPYLQLADPSTGRELRIYFDSDLAVRPDYLGLDQDDDKVITGLDSLMGASVTQADTDGGKLEIQFGSQSLVVAAAGNHLTTHEPWWMGWVD